MDTMLWLQIIAAVMAGNLLSASVLYFFLRLSKHERHSKAHTMHPALFLMALVPMGIFGFGVHLIN